MDKGKTTVRQATEHFEVHVQSSRSNQPEELQAMREWLSQRVANDLPDTDLSFLEAIQWPTEKPLAFLTIDDQAPTFTGEWPNLACLR